MPDITDFPESMKDKKEQNRQEDNRGGGGTGRIAVMERQPSLSNLSGASGGMVKHSLAISAASF
ncbi:hypothetical protein [Rhizobium sp. BR 315]|uniref:hypothetical protein n=1 Tax=Rhizobium sp. BR 315 TaxID=3040014 RepID=UPI003D34FF73